MFELLKKTGAWLKKQAFLALCVAAVFALGHYGVLAMPDVKSILCGIVAGVASRG